MPFFVEITNLFSRSAHGSHCPGPVSEKRVAVTVTPAENMMQFAAAVRLIPGTGRIVLQAYIMHFCVISWMGERRRVC